MQPSPVQGNGASLLGRNWFALLGIGVASIHKTLMGPAPLESLLDKFCSVFNADLAACTGLPVHLDLLEGVMPNFLKACLVPYALCPAVEAERD